MFFCCSHDECVELLLKHGAKVDVEARMCWPGPHSSNCEARGNKWKGKAKRSETGEGNSAEIGVQSDFCLVVSGVTSRVL